MVCVDEVPLLEGASVGEGEVVNLDETQNKKATKMKVRKLSKTLLNTNTNRKKKLVATTVKKTADITIKAQLLHRLHKYLLSFSHAKSLLKQNREN